LLLTRNEVFANTNFDDPAVPKPASQHKTVLQRSVSFTETKALQQSNMYRFL